MMAPKENFIEAIIKQRTYMRTESIYHVTFALTDRLSGKYGLVNSSNTKCINIKK